MKTAGLAVLAMLWVAPALAACPAGQGEMLTVRLYFGQTMQGRAVSQSAWRDFVARDLTANFPGGFTVYDASGQWRDPRTRRVRQEPSKVVEIAAPDTRDLRARVETVRRDYAARFRQQSVGLLMFPACGTF